MNSTMMELSREMMKAGIIDEVHCCRHQPIKAKPENSYMRCMARLSWHQPWILCLPAQMMTDSIDSALDTDEMEDETEEEVEKVIGRPDPSLTVPQCCCVSP